MRRVFASIGLLICAGGCDSFFTANPNNCVANPKLCDVGSVCNAETKHCEPAAAPPDLATPQCASFVIGQPDGETVQNLLWGLSRPTGVLLFRDQGAGGQRKLAVADTGNNRVLIWNQVPTDPAARKPPDVVLGQTDFTTNVSNFGVLGPKTMSGPSSLASDGARLFVGDEANRRVLVFDPIPTSHFSPATAVWGQTDLAKNTRATTPTASVLNATNLFIDKLGQLFIGDTGFARVLGFSTYPKLPTAMPSWLFGQPDYVSMTAGNGDNNLNGPDGAAYSDGTTLYVTDTLNDRLLTYALPAAAPMPSRVMSIGQTFAAGVKSGTICSNTANASCLFRPIGVTAGDCGAASPCLFVADANNNRVVRFQAGATAADLVLGQSVFTTRTNLFPATAASMSGPNAVSCDGTTLAVADTGNSRILLYALPLTGSGQSANVVLGQPDTSSNAVNAPPQINALSFNSVSSISSDGTRLVVADTGSNRVLLWNALPPNASTPPDVILGQASDATNLSNGGTTTLTASSLSSPLGVHLAGGRLAVADQRNHRVLIWNSVPAASNAPADIVIGQTDFTKGSVNGGGASPSGSTLSSPSWVHMTDTGIWVADTNNHRVLRFDNPYASSSGAVAALILGQAAANVGANNAGGTVADSSLSSPNAVATDGKRLVISDSGNNRVVVYSALPTVGKQAGDLFLGQPNGTSNAAPGNAAPDNVSGPCGVMLKGDDSLWVADCGSNRLVGWTQFPTNGLQPADTVLGQPDLRSRLQNNSALPPVRWLNAARGMTTANGLLYIADTGNSRVVVTLPP